MFREVFAAYFGTYEKHNEKFMDEIVLMIKYVVHIPTTLI